MSYEDEKLPQSNLLFPSEFTIKVIGKNSPDFEISALYAIKKHCLKLSETALNIKESKHKKYLALNVTLEIETQEQLEAIYRELNDCKHVIMTL